MKIVLVAVVRSRASIKRLYNVHALEYSSICHTKGILLWGL